MKRDDWTVPYSGEALLEASKAKHKFHTERRAWWRTKKKEVIDQLEQGGLKVDESIVEELAKSGYSTSMAFSNQSAAGEPKVRVNQELQNKLRESHYKVVEHDGKIVEYDAWIQMLMQHQRGSFDLDQEDWIFFYGHTRRQDQ